MSERGAEQAEPVAAIDIGSNELRMVIAQVHSDNRTEVLERARRAVRLGHDTFLTGRLSQKTLNAAIDVLRQYGRMLDTYGVERVRAVATSAVREASNRDAFIDRVARTVGIDLEVIEVGEQVRLIVLAVRDAVQEAVPLAARPSLIAEVGGGGTLMAVLRDGEIAASTSYNIGAVRMQETLATAREPVHRAARLLRQHAGRTVEQAARTLELDAVETFVAIGGDARFAAQQAGLPVRGDHLFSVAADDLAALVDECAPHPAEELARIHRLPFAAAETLVPALLVYQQLLEATAADRMIVSQVSMRDGLVLDLPRYLSGEEDPAMAASIVRSAYNIAAKYGVDKDHADHVANLSLRLFDELQGEHGLQPRHRLLLRVAALLHDAGAYVSNRAHHKHSYYLISNADIVGLSGDDIATVAHVARYHRRSMPKSSHADYAALGRQQRMVINKLAALLRVADALDRGHWQQVYDFTVEREGQEMLIYVRGAGDLTLERRALAEKADLFEDLFGMHVRLEGEGDELQRSAEGRRPLSGF